MAMVTQHGALVLMKNLDSLQLDLMGDRPQIGGSVCTLIEIPLLELME